MNRRSFLSLGLNAPYGARCFLTEGEKRTVVELQVDVLMRLMALGAFSLA